MKILAISDHVSDPDEIKRIIMRDNPDLIITLGDLDQVSLQYLSQIETPKIGVYGNHCKEDYFDVLDILPLHMKTFYAQGKTIGGFQGCVKYKEAKYHYTQAEGRKILELPPVDIMITHAPPQGVNDDPIEDTHNGFEAFAEYIHRNQPSFWFHGHTYPDKEQKISKYLNTTVIYVHGVELFDLDKIKGGHYPPAKSYTRNPIDEW